MSEGFSAWCVVEVMGHQQYAGLVSEEVIAGAGFIRVDVPESEGVPEFTKLLAPKSIYCITPCSEEVAVEAAKRMRKRPMPILDIPFQRQLPGTLADVTDDNDYDGYGYHDDDDDDRHPF